MVTVAVTVTLVIGLYAGAAMRLPDTLTAPTSALARVWRTFCLWRARQLCRRWWRVYLDLRRRSGVEVNESAELDAIYQAELRWERRAGLKRTEWRRTR